MIYRTLVVLSLVAMFAVVVYEGSGPTVPYDPQVPAFTNPFDELQTKFSNITAVPDYPFQIDEVNDWEVTVSGCDEGSYDTLDCINTNDRENSYIRFNVPSTNQLRVMFNWSYPGLMEIDHTQVRRVFYTISCRTQTANITPPFIVMAGMALTTNYNSCPRGDSFATISLQRDYPSGAQDFILDILYSTFEGYISLEHQTPENQQTSGIVDVSFIRLDIVLTTVQGCRAPDGAWFPGLDEFACGLGVIGDIAWKGLVFIFNGFIYLAQWFINIGQYVANGLSVIAWLYTIPGLPIYIQGFVDVIVSLWIVVLGIESFKLLKPFGD